MVNNAKVVALIFLLAAAGCRKEIPSALITLKGAAKVSSYSLAGMEVLEYGLLEKYPAEKSLAEISRRLQEKGWKPLDYVFLSPKYKSSHVKGWSIYYDPPRSPTRVVYEWSGDWQDSHGNVTTYTFQYEDPIEKYRQPTFLLRPGNSKLRITGLYMSEAVAKRKQAELNPK